MNILLLIIAAFFAAFGQLSLKKSAITSKTSGVINYILSLFGNPFAWLSVVFYGISLLLYMIVLRKEELSIARSFSALSYILVITSSIFLFKESISLIKLSGIVFIAIGILLLGLSLGK